MADTDYASNTINTDTTNFGRILGATEDDVQKALDVIDNKAGDISATNTWSLEQTFSSGIKTNTITTTPSGTDLSIVTGTDKTLLLSETVYDDIQFATSTGKVPAANYPTWETFTPNTEAYAFSVDDKIQLEANEPFHGWKEGTIGSAHIHFTNKTAQNTGANRYVKFEIIAAYADYNGVWTEQAALNGESTIPTGTAALTNFLAVIGNVTLTGLHLGTQILFRLRRISATGGTEYADDVYITQAGLHLEKDTIGSRTISSK